MTDRLSRDEWLRCGLKALAEQGDKALRADPLARELGVSRGSFYWHFKNLGDFHTAILDAWRDRATVAVIEQIAAAPEGKDRLARLMQGAFASDLSLERGVRAWATHDARAAKAVEEVDRLRVDYLAKLIEEAGLSTEDAATRARFLNWAYLGRMVAQGEASAPLAEAEAAALAALLGR